jgi:DNA-binding PucR family transcriptional regulator
MTSEVSYDERRHEILDEILARRHELAHELVEEYRRVIEEYRELPEPVLTRDVAEVAVQNIEHMVRTFHDGFEIDGGSHEWLRRSAARRVHQRVSLPSLLRTFRLWGNHLWLSIARAAGDDPLGQRIALDAAAAMMAYVDHVSAGVTQAYIRESSAISVDGTALRTDVLETLLTGETVNERARRQAAVLGMSWRARLLVVVVQLPQRDDPFTGVQAAVRAARNLLSPVSRSCLVGARDTEVVCICPVESEDDARDVADAADRLVASDRGWTVGLGRPHDGLAGVRRSYGEAREAADLGFSARRPDRAIRFTDVLLDQILRSSRYTDALLEETVAPLADYDERKRAELVPTLRAYVAANFNLTKAASALSVNPNTVVYRLRRIHALTGRDPAAVDDLLLLALGLRLHDSVPPLT